MSWELKPEKTKIKQSQTLTGKKLHHEETIALPNNIGLATI